ncbi:MAG: tRNA pseudouridine synthase A, partial [Oscillospiraceae bacterium]|nr:tRNA pseudouridine synthase A [Oscillospiraceae bacterium]
MNVLVKLCYDGTAYCGFQIQDDRPTVFATFQTALLKILGHPTDIKGCSRTDSGVHAKEFCLSFRTEKQLNLYRLPLALNANLPPDIRVLEAVQVPEDFHARYSSKGKEY